MDWYKEKKKEKKWKKQGEGHALGSADDQDAARQLIDTPFKHMQAWAKSVRAAVERFGCLKPIETFDPPAHQRRLKFEVKDGKTIPALADSDRGEAAELAAQEHPSNVPPYVFEAIGQGVAGQGTEEDSRKRVRTG